VKKRRLRLAAGQRRADYKTDYIRAGRSWTTLDDLSPKNRQFKRDLDVLGRSWTARRVLHNRRLPVRFLSHLPTKPEFICAAPTCLNDLRQVISNQAISRSLSGLKQSFRSASLVSGDGRGYTTRHSRVEVSSRLYGARAPVASVASSFTAVRYETSQRTPCGNHPAYASYPPVARMFVLGPAAWCIMRVCAERRYALRVLATSRRVRKGSISWQTPKRRYHQQVGPPPPACARA
jgi:hypothetical protein